MPSIQMVILYDGVCGLCHRCVQFVLKHDRNDVFRFASLQSSWARQKLIEHHLTVEEKDSIRLLIHQDQPSEYVLSQGEAVIRILQSLSGYRFLAGVLKILPRSLLNWGYRLVARYRYGFFGKYDSCPLPSEKDKKKFIEV